LQVLSANKLLGQLGQTMPIPSLGFRFGAATHHFDQTIVLVLSHSGGTYAPLACCSLLSGFTSNIFVVTSELDTQAARAVRSVSGGGGGGSGGSGGSGGAGGAAAPFIDLSSQFVFSTHVGFRSAEPCSVSVVATHHLLTQLLLFLMGFLIHFEHIPQLPPPSGASTASPNGGRSDTAAGAAGAAGPPIPRHLPTSDAPAAAATTASAAATAAATATPAWPAPISICGSSFELAEVRELAIDCDGFRLRLIAIDSD
jgi:hypothetical protein